MSSDAQRNIELSERGTQFFMMNLLGHDPIHDYHTDERFNISMELIMSITNSLGKTLKLDNTNTASTSKTSGVKRPFIVGGMDNIFNRLIRDTIARPVEKKHSLVTKIKSKTSTKLKSKTSTKLKSKTQQLILSLRNNTESLSSTTEKKYTKFFPKINSLFSSFHNDQAVSFTFILYTYAFYDIYSFVYFDIFDRRTAHSDSSAIHVYQLIFRIFEQMYLQGVDTAIEQFGELRDNRMLEFYARFLRKLSAYACSYFSNWHAKRGPSTNILQYSNTGIEKTSFIDIFCQFLNEDFISDAFLDTYAECKFNISLHGLTARKLTKLLSKKFRSAKTYRGGAPIVRLETQLTLNDEQPVVGSAELFAQLPSIDAATGVSQTSVETLDSILQDLMDFRNETTRKLHLFMSKWDNERTEYDDILKEDYNALRKEVFEDLKLLIMEEIADSEDVSISANFLKILKMKRSDVQVFLEKSLLPIIISQTYKQTIAELTTNFKTAFDNSFIGPITVERMKLVSRMQAREEKMRREAIANQSRDKKIADKIEMIKQACLKKGFAELPGQSTTANEMQIEEEQRYAMKYLKSDFIRTFATMGKIMAGLRERPVQPASRGSTTIVDMITDQLLRTEHALLSKQETSTGSKGTEMDKTLYDTTVSIIDDILKEHHKLVELQRDLNIPEDATNYKDAFYCARKAPVMNLINPLENKKPIYKNPIPCDGQNGKYVINNSAAGLATGLIEHSRCTMCSILDGMRECAYEMRKGKYEYGNMHFRVGQPNKYYEGELTVNPDDGSPPTSCTYKIRIRSPEFNKGAPLDISTIISELLLGKNPYNSIKLGGQSPLTARNVLMTTFACIQGFFKIYPDFKLIRLPDYSINELFLAMMKSTNESANGSAEYIRGIRFVGAFASIFFKGSGDFFQEINSLCKFGGYSDKRSYNTDIENEEDNYFGKSGNVGNPYRLFLANDQPSACRAAFLLLTARLEDINENAIVSYSGEKKWFYVGRGLIERAGATGKGVIKSLKNLCPAPGVIGGVSIFRNNHTRKNEKNGFSRTFKKQR